MAEYIDKNELIRFLNNLKQPRHPITEGFTFISIDDAIKVVIEKPTADVVEQEKIDNAIKVANDYISTAFKLGLNERAFGMREILEVFIKNIKGVIMIKQEENNELPFIVYEIIYENLRSGIKHDISIKPSVMCDIAKFILIMVDKMQDLEGDADK